MPGLGNRRPWGSLLATLGLAASGAYATEADQRPIVAPRAIDSRLTIELFAAEPDIVTPVKMAVDRQGRAMVIENHTHFRPEDYAGPETDRIRVCQDTNGDGRADKFTTFYEGTKNTMGLAIRNEWTYVATRDEVLRIRDSDGDGAADERQQLVKLDTPTEYPHNGLGSMTFDAAGRLYLGLGENFGGDVRLTGSDGTVIHSPGLAGEIYRCLADGAKLEKIASGFWNPFGLCFDRAGRLFAVDNDPGSRPPCRLLHVVPGGDYGFRWKFDRGRGSNALVSWNGELPGTLGMASITGEGPCEVLAASADAFPSDLVDDLIATSWGSHRIERFTLAPHGASFRAVRQDLAVGGPDFRPVGMAVSPDGWIYVSDWVKFDYPVHRQGRIWRMRWSDVGPSAQQTTSMPEELRAAALGDDRTPTNRLLDAFSASDPFIRHAAVVSLANHREELERLDWKLSGDAKQRLGMLLAFWKSGRPEARKVIPSALSDADANVRIAAVRWVADEWLVEFLPAIRKSIEDGEGSDRHFAVCIATLTALEESPASADVPAEIERTLASMAFDNRLSAVVRLRALRALPANHAQLSLEKLQPLIDVQNPAPLILEGVRALAERHEAGRFDLLARVAVNSAYAPEARADAVVALCEAAESHADAFRTLADDESSVVRDEAARAVRSVALPAETRGESAPAPRGQAAANDRPAGDDVAAWIKRLEGPADAAAGRRIFFHPRIGRCYRCHGMNGRGAHFGPDLSEIGRHADRERILESILLPSREIAPQYVTWIVETRDGRQIVGFHAQENNPEQAVKYMDASGQLVEIKENAMARRIASPVSIMPDNMIQSMTDQELRDLLKFLCDAGE